MSALATLGFAGGPQLVFRINPSEIAWNFKVHTTVIDTIGGRVVQVTGATPSDLTVTGYLGEDRTQPGPTSSDRHAGRIDHQGVSWRLHEAFVNTCRAIMAYQSRDASKTGLMHEPAVFTYPPRNWRWRVYLKAVEDLDGTGSIEHRTGKFSHAYRLTLFPVLNGSDAIVKAGQSLDGFEQAKAQAISAYIERISKGIGWRQSKYNGGLDNPSPAPSNGG